MRLVKSFPLLLALGLSVAACGTGGKQAGEPSATNVGEAALAAGTPEAALRLADEALSKNRDDVGALTRRGLALTALGRLEEARVSLRRAVTAQPNDVRALLALGRVQLPVDPAEAETNFEAALKVESQNAAALNNLGIARDLQGHHVDAEAAYRAALVAAPDMSSAQVNLALCLAMRGKGNEAIAMLRPLAEGPTATRKIKEDYAAVLAMSGERTEAERILSDNLGNNEVGPALDVLASAKAIKVGL